MTFAFANPVSAFGFNWGASDVLWNLMAYNSSDQLLDTHVLPILVNNNNGEFYGIAETDISYANLIMTGQDDTDWVMVDNFTYSEGNSAVPEPASLFLFRSGIIGFILYKIAIV